MSAEIALAILGLTLPVTPADISAARRRLAKTAHPDLGGLNVDMSLINLAADVLLHADLGRVNVDGVTAAHGVESNPSQPDAGPRVGGRRRSPVSVDHPSFVIEALPVEAFEALLVVASWLGDVIDDEPPYRLEVALTEPRGTWCQLALVPDAGGSTVSITLGRFTDRDDSGAGSGAVSDLDVLAVRDEWVRGLNQLDWDDLTRP